MDLVRVIATASSDTLGCIKRLRLPCCGRTIRYIYKQLYSQAM